VVPRTPTFPNRWPTFSTSAGDGARKFGEFPCRDGEISTGLDTSEGVSDGGDVGFLPKPGVSLRVWEAEKIAGPNSGSRIVWKTHQFPGAFAVCFRGG